MQLLEREVEIDALTACLSSARQGRGRFVLVAGEAGIGKTALVRAFCEQVRGARILRGACDALATPRPLGPLMDIVDRLGGALTELDPTSSRDALFRGFLAELASPSWVTVAVIEDAHWADGASLDLLRYLARRIEDVPALLVVTFRPQEVGADHPLSLLAGELATSGVVRQLALDPLSRRAVAELAGEATDSEVDELHRQTGGNPFYVTEALAAGTGNVPATVRDAVLARLARLATSPRAAAEAAAIAPTRIEHQLLQSLAGVSPADIDTCVAAGVLAPDAPGCVAFRHELARLAVEASLPPARRADLHDSAVDLLLGRADADPARVAHHAEQAGRADIAFEQAVLAARRAEALGSHREAADQYERALRHREGQPLDAIGTVLEATALAAVSADRVDTAVAAADEAVALRRRLGDPLRLGSALVTRNAAIWNAGRSQEAYADGLAAVELLESLPPSDELAAAYAFVATDKMLARDYEAAAAWGTKAVALAEELGVAAPLARALNSMGAARILDGDLGGADDIRRSIAVAEREGLHANVASAWINLGSAAGEVRAYALAEEGLSTGIAVARERDLDGSTHYGAAWLARVRFEQGAWDEAQMIAQDLPLDRPGTLAITTITGLVTLGRIGVRRGELEHGAAVLERAWELAQQTADLQRLWPAAAGRAEAAWLRGELGAVQEAAQTTHDLAHVLRHRWAIGELAMWLRRAGTEVDVSPWAAEPYRLQLDGDWRQAAEAWSALGCPYEQAEALEAGDDPDGLSASLTVFDRLGARPAADRVRRRLRELGVRNVPRRPQQTTSEHPAGLTRRQAEVLDLLARGMTDAEIAAQLSISVKTAGHHVSAILARLGAASRTEAARRAYELGLVTPGER